MRLLNTKTFRVESFYADTPKYAILSHTWDKEEVNFQDMQNLWLAKRKTGWRKIKKACAHALKYDFEWIWIDSCCINKESSAELSEALNSMYQYYEEAEVCYAYLSDASSKEDPRDINSVFKRCRWFKRGWTLQELLAPAYVVFFDRDWVEIGTRWSLRDVISAITSIPTHVFEDGDLTRYSIAQRMSWAALRRTTRPEDQAYCLMGIFGVSMPPIYGEGGAKAFMRLQQEIIKISDDRSIFAWTSPKDEREPRGLLARSPYEFRTSGEVGISVSDVIGDKSSYSFGNNGLRIYLPLSPTEDPNLLLASLHCQSEKDYSYLSVYLQKTEGQQYIRYRPNELALSSSLPPSEDMRELVVKEFPAPHKIKRSFTGIARTAHLRLLPSAQDYFVFETCSGASFDEQTKQLTIGGHQIASLKYSARDGQCHFAISMGTLSFKLVTDKSDSYSIYGESQRTDRYLKPLKNGGLVSLAVQMSGDHWPSWILEIDYIPKENGNGFLIPRPLQPPKLGFVVLRWKSYEGVFPSDLFDRSCEGLYFPICQVDPGDSSSTFRVLAFDEEKSITVYVTLGFQGSTPWTDVVVDQSGRAEEIWRSYVGSGSRVEHRIDCRTSASVIAGGLDLTVTIEERTTLQFGSHIVRLDYTTNPRHPKTLSGPHSVSSYSNHALVCDQSQPDSCHTGSPMSCTPSYSLEHLNIQNYPLQSSDLQ
ncbi:hypothetical protein VKT23_008045 [Stygiomarasmius scandens]|uniref:Heterokaryon incompatibility domain-containing protein n=1 Tax=Marasmiellus scandens TaxID=2682957 RepID=A0ABR1JK40_9AGAR